MSDRNRTEKLLEQERTRLTDIRSSLTEVAEDVERDPTGDPSAGGHVADAGSEMFERSRDLSIISEIDAQLIDIDHAEARLSNGTYGTCEACGKAIGPRGWPCARPPGIASRIRSAWSARCRRGARE